MPSSRAWRLIQISHPSLGPHMANGDIRIARRHLLLALKCFAVANVMMLAATAFATPRSTLQALRGGYWRR